MTTMNRPVAVLVVLAAIGAAAVFGFRSPARLPDDRPVAPDAAARSRPPPVPAVVASRFAPAKREFRTAASAPSGSLPDGPFGATTGELERMAGLGDAQAAARLAAGYRRCQFVEQHVDAAELEKRSIERTATGLEMTEHLASRITAQARKQGVDIELPKADPVKVYEADLASQKSEQVDCAGVDGGKAQAWFDWYERAAGLGDPDAEVGYWHEAFSNASIVDLDHIAQRREIATAALRHALGRGDARALAGVGELLALGYLDEPDPAAAYAYFYAASLAPAQPIETIPWIGNSFGRLFTGNDTGTWLSRELGELARNLDPGRIADAERAGAQLYAQCCAGAGK